MARARTLGVAALMGVVGVASVASGQVGPRAGQYPDVIVSSVGGSYDTTGSGAIQSYGTSGGITAYAIGSDSCNLGSAQAIWISSNNQHPVIGGAVYRMFNGRFEQIGISWLKHGFCAADSCGSTGRGCSDISPAPAGAGNCTTDFGPSGGCDWLGYGRATDTYGSGLNGGQQYLGPRSEVNAWSGYYPYPYVRQGTNPVSCLNKRLLIRKTDLDPALYPRYNATSNPGGAQYFGEVVYIVSDEWPTERMNNYSHRRITPGALTAGASGCTEQGYTLDFAAADRTVPLKPAITAWQTADPTVKLNYADAPNDGRFYVGSKVTDRGDGTWQYEYAVFNMNSDRSGGSFSIAKSSGGVTVTKQEFKGVEYHSGEPYSMKPWDMSVGAQAISWATTPYAQNANANALRWSTLYNFRFIANVPPVTGSVRIGLFKPAVNPGDADSVMVSGVHVPGQPALCPADYDGQNGVDILDIFAFLNSWFSTCTGPGAPVSTCTKSADFDGQNGVDLQDIFAFLNAWFTGCP